MAGDQLHKAWDRVKGKGCCWGASMGFDGWYEDDFTHREKIEETYL